MKKVFNINYSEITYKEKHTFNINMCILTSNGGTEENRTPVRK